MLAFQCVTPFLFYVKVFNTTLQSGAESISSKKGIIMYIRWDTYLSTKAIHTEELFNLWHASVCNIIKCIFGVLKWWFHVLVHPPEYDMDIQAHLLPALAALHNFIHIHDPDGINNMLHPDDVDVEATSSLATELLRWAEKVWVNNRRDEIDWDMWYQYQDEPKRRGLISAQSSWCTMTIVFMNRTMYNNWTCINSTHEDTKLFATWPFINWRW